jgi:transcriptional regulator with XRE-family HTH domain
MKNKIDTKEIGSIIKRMREDSGLTQNDFAKKLKTSQSAVARIESGGSGLSIVEMHFV